MLTRDLPYKLLRVLALAALGLLLAPLAERLHTAADAAVAIRGIPLCFYCDEKADWDAPPGELVPIMVTWWECAEGQGVGYNECDADWGWVYQNSQWIWQADCEEWSPTENCLPLEALASAHLAATGRVALLPTMTGVPEDEERGCGNTLLARRYDSGSRVMIAASSSTLVF